MTERARSPLAAAVGLAVTSARGLRRLPSLLGTLPVTVARQLEATRQAARQRYDELALHGREVLAARGRDAAARAEGAPDRAAGLVDEAAAVTAATAGRVSDVVGSRAEAVAPAADEAADRVAGGAERVAEAAGRVADRVDRGDRTGGELAARAADASVEREAAPPAPAPAPPIGRTEPVALPEEVLDEVAQRPSGAELGHQDLPLPDFDHMTVPQLRGRLRTLTLPELVQLRDYESAHASRVPVLTLLDNRIAKLSDSPTR